MDEQRKNKLINRAHRIEGQIRGVENMIREERSYHEIIPQLKAISSATQQIMTELIRDLLNKKTLSGEERAYVLKLISKD